MDYSIIFCSDVLVSHIENLPYHNNDITHRCFLCLIWFVFHMLQFIDYFKNCLFLNHELKIVIFTGGTKRGDRERAPIHMPMIRLETVENHWMYCLINAFWQFYSENICDSGRNQTFNLWGTDPLSSKASSTEQLFLRRTESSYYKSSTIISNLSLS